MADLKCPDCGSPVKVGYYDVRCTKPRKCGGWWDQDGSSFRD